MIEQQQNTDEELRFSPTLSIEQESVSSVNSIWPAVRLADLYKSCAIVTGGTKTPSSFAVQRKLGFRQLLRKISSDVVRGNQSGFQQHVDL